MNQKVNGHTAAYLKRQAKTIQKTQKVTYSEALNLAAMGAGFSNWRNFTNKSKTAVQRETEPVDPTVNSESGSGNETLSTPAKMNPYRKLLVAATNELLQRKLISLVAEGDHNLNDKRGHILTDLFGYPSVITWCDIGWEELQISVWWKYNHSLHPQANLTGNYKENFTCSQPLASKHKYKGFVGVTASTWLERMTGKHLQGKGRGSIFGIYTRKGELAELDKLPTPKPNGFQSEGKFFI